MNRYKISLTFTSSAEDRTLYYKVAVTSGINLFYGKCYCPANTSTITLDITDVLQNCVYRGWELLTPTFYQTGYYQPHIDDSNQRTTTIPTTNLEQHFNPITVTLYSDTNLTNQISTKSVNIYFHSIPFMTPSYEDRLGNQVSYQIDFDLVPRLPRVATDKIRYGQLVYSYTSENPYWYKGSSANTITSFGAGSGSRIISYRLDQLVPNMTGYQTVQGVNNGQRTDILRLDDCAAPYYLMWLNPNGGLQSWPFKPSSVYTEEHTRNMRLTMDEQSYVSNHSLSGNWKLKTDLVTDAQYRALLGCTLSPYTILYITELDRVFYVNCSDAKTELKTYANQGRKLSIFEVDVKSAEQEFYVI